MQGARRDIANLQAGEYGKNPTDGKWYCCTPNDHYGCLAGHDVTEHEDGTITVSPSILVDYPQGDALWHGYLERGIWREV